MSDDKRHKEKERDDVMTSDDKAEVKARLEKAWDALEDQPSTAPGFEGATPRKLAKALFNLGRKGEG